MFQQEPRGTTTLLPCKCKDPELLHSSMGGASCKWKGGKGGGGGEEGLIYSKCVYAYCMLLLLNKISAAETAAAESAAAEDRAYVFHSKTCDLH